MPSKGVALNSQPRMREINGLLVNSSKRSTVLLHFVTSIRLKFYKINWHELLFNRMLNKRIKDKIDDIDRLTKELELDAKKKVELENDVEVTK